MHQKLLNAVYMERKHAYHMLTAIKETIETEMNISEKTKNFIIDTQREMEELYLIVSHDIHCNYPEREEMNNGYTVKSL